MMAEVSEGFAVVGGLGDRRAMAGRVLEGTGRMNNHS
jgi:hypothetical protein